MTHSDAPAADLFGSAPAELPLAPQALLLQGFALPYVPRLLAALQAIAQAAPFRHMRTPGGLEMSVALTNCGALGWTSDSRGYRYSAHDPDSGQPWPPLPEVLLQLAHAAAARAGFAGFVPDACLVNRYRPGARLSLHQDKDERDYSAPIVSVSLGIPATFLLGGFRRNDKSLRVPLVHGDVVVWGGADRLRYHGVLAVPQAEHPLLGAQRINFTLRKAG
ncbi:alkylated DNA repair protein (DNA oxidative demethylase) [Rhodoferax ferrireducens]|uniref:Alkylated DNA repair protein (DNA oxidative demethylase) n=1 Tax=Rhodoferax ferrireducens TaxID=192843 RepID=A0ABU2CFT0_9BURK|nr:DNA oxidative demethylase AlkB [Rhodoferax ferrireducens]MDR7380199.1 alkylated DNA repair protein (DNA oxidative demethylase) [Rhodoferax ferrireducens]